MRYLLFSILIISAEVFPQHYLKQNESSLLKGLNLSTPERYVNTMSVVAVFMDTTIRNVSVVNWGMYKDSTCFNVNDFVLCLRNCYMKRSTDGIDLYGIRILTNDVYFVKFYIHNDGLSISITNTIRNGFPTFFLSSYIDKNIQD